MRYLVFACDYDGTLASEGRVARGTLSTLEQLVASGRKLILVTGRQLGDLQSVFAHLDLFEWVVGENGALLYRPNDKLEKILGEAPPEQFVAALRKRKVDPLFLGRVVVATWKPHETVVLETIRDLGLELQVIFNKEAVMVLPAGVNKATGLKAVLKELGFSLHNVVGVGDAENDHAFMSACECSVAVANALPTIRERADVVTQGTHGNGVVELANQLLADDLRQFDSRLTRHHIVIGTSDGNEVRMPPYGINVLLAGTSGSGKTTLATGLLERLVEQDYQVCILDPEGDYENLEGAVVLGSRQGVPQIDEILQLLENPETHAVINLLGVPYDERPPFFQNLFPRLQEMRARNGRPHWLVVDETHHLLPASWKPASLTLPEQPQGMIFITVNPKEVMPAALALVDLVLAVGETPGKTVQAFSESAGHEAPKLEHMTLQAGQAVSWSLRSTSAPLMVNIPPSRTERQRHQRKYAEGELSPEKSFYFRGPENKLNLRAHNLILFLQIAEGIDDATWTHHLHRGDYSRWFRKVIKDESLAVEIARVEELPGISPSESRMLIKAAVEQHYTLPAESSKLIPGHGAPTEKPPKM
ncbi:MAG: HAD-IIB family hydrolase [Acidobacteria bacterium]|nr:HAD-IIB family hydrolase [Acidobacteriota bacterium]MCI0717390.1 HAD-IIB family hydrolase [Acidobacteriota bacterium]